MDLSKYDEEREQLVEQEAAILYHEYLIDLAKFDQLDAECEFMNANIGHVQRALRNLDDAIDGKEYARDAIFTALRYMQDNLKHICKEEAEETIVSAHDLYESDQAEALDAKMDAARDNRGGL